MILETFLHDGVEYQLPSPNGLMFQSTASNYRLAVRGTRPIYDSGVLIGSEKELVLEFGDPDAPSTTDEEGGVHVHFRGHYAHTLEQGKKKEWTDAERALVEKKALVTQAPKEHWLHSKAPAGKPWPSYDAIDAKRIPQMAGELGLLDEAFLYEVENKNRKTVVDGLRELLTPPEPEPVELAAA